MPESDVTISLREITRETLDAVLNLKVTPEQEGYVSSNAWSIAEARFKEEAWFRAIYADDIPVGFLMLEDVESLPRYFLWRLMVDAEHEGKGYGLRAVELLIDHVKTRPGATELLVSYQPGEHSPVGFYIRLGFEHTGRTVGPDLEMTLPL